MKPRAVLDASALLNKERHELLYASRLNLYTIVWSAFVIAEFVRVRTELALKHGLDPRENRSRINAFIHEASLRAVMVNYTRLQGGNYTPWLRDVDDEPVLATALVGKAQYIVSWNTHDFPPGGIFAGVHYVTPVQFLDELYSQHPDKNLPGDFADSGFRVP